MPKPRIPVQKARRAEAISRKRKQARKVRLLTRGVPSVTRSIADAVCIKNGNIFLVSQSDGNIPIMDSHGYGLYYHDCRYLSGYEVRVAHEAPIVLAGATGEIGTATFELTNPHLELTGSKQLGSGEIGIAWDRRLDPVGIRLIDHLSVKNYALSSVRLPLTLTFHSDFEDIFAVRGLFSERPGKLHPPEWRAGKLVFRYDGADGYLRELELSFSPQPEARRTRSVRYGIALERLETSDIQISLTITEHAPTQRSESSQVVMAGHKSVDPKLPASQASSDWCKDWPEIQSDSPVLNQVIDRAKRDLQSLWTSIRGDGFFAAGIPWFATLFGRDSLITAMQMLPMTPTIAAQTLRLLSMYQAHEVDPWRDAQPGKILHELRVGELATIGDTPHSPYYGTVDATPLFLILLDEYATWTGDLDLFHELQDSAERALQWIDRYGDSDGDGYVDYKTASNQGLVNQGWKDSIDAILNADGSYATPPIALVEVQGYVYRARLALAHLYEQSGLPERAAELRGSAENLRTRFNHDFWSDELATYYLALQQGGRPAAVVASNAGHALWSGIADRDHAQRTVQRLMASDMFSGWGIRTLSQREKGYNPIGYHVGSIWPHDNAMIADGFRRYGFQDEALQLFMGVFEAAMNFQEFQLPELYSGFSREQYNVPVHYPAACHPQAWAAGSIPYLLCSLLGLQPHAAERKLEIQQPTLPPSVSTLDIAGLHVGPFKVNIRYGRASDGRTVVRDIKSDPDLQVSIL